MATRSVTSQKVGSEGDIVVGPGPLARAALIVPETGCAVLQLF